MEHCKQHIVEKLINYNIPVMLVGEAGSGKTTILQKCAEKAGVPYSFIAGTRQTTVSNILGFMSVNGTYVKSTFRKAYEEGHYFNIDEIDAMDANCLLLFNSLENNMIAFPDGYSEPPHENFRLMATANPMKEHSAYTGRTKLDAASLDRFDIIDIDRDDSLEISLVGEKIFKKIKLLRECLKHTCSSKEISMRDAIRLKKRTELGLSSGFIEKLLEDNGVALNMYKTELENDFDVLDIEEAETLKDLWKLLQTCKA